MFNKLPDILYWKTEAIKQVARIWRVDVSNLSYADAEYEFVTDNECRDTPIESFPLFPELLAISNATHAYYPSACIKMFVCRDLGIKYFICYCSLGDIYINLLVTMRGDLWKVIRHNKRQSKVSAAKNIIKPCLKENIIDAMEQNVIGLLKNKKKFKNFGVYPRRGILLYGPPGNGKSMLCKYLLQRSSFEGFTVAKRDSAEVISAFNQNKTRCLFEQQVNFFDDIDISILSRNASSHSDIACSFLSAMDGMGDKKPRVCIFTTNESHLDIDSAFLRPGRIDFCHKIDKPDGELRKKLILSWHKEVVSHLNVEKTVEMTENMSFSDIECVKGIFVLSNIEKGTWDWDEAFRKFKDDRPQKEKKTLGFSSALLK